jgi:type VI secretion system (T6SS) effector TldE1-like protein
MKQKNKREFLTNPQATRLYDRLFLVVIASTALLLSALAITVFMNGSFEQPTGNLSSISSPETLKLAIIENQVASALVRAEPVINQKPVERKEAKKLAPTVDLSATLEAARLERQAQAAKVSQLILTSKPTTVQAAVSVAAPTLAPQSAAKPVAPVEYQTEEDVKVKAAAEKAAKSLLAAKLALLRPTSQQLANLAKANSQIEETAKPNKNVATVPSDLAPRTHHPEQIAALEIRSGAPLDQLASLAKPGAIQPPVPGTKPTPPQRPATLASTNESQSSKPSPATLAYAAPGNPDDTENGAFSGIGKLFNGSKNGMPSAARGIAVYDISAAVVHMPDGTKLEAHSGIGHRKDNPKHAYVRNLGPTPPNIYKLRMRERLFHGVEAIRMLPHDQAAMKGRDGMLAHTPLLRRSNGSHGCVAFKHYAKFLKAFKAGKVKTMIVVPSMAELPTYMAALDQKTKV